MEGGHRVVAAAPGLLTGDPVDPKSGLNVF